MSENMNGNRSLAQNKRVLILEDNADLVELLKEMISERAQGDVVTAEKAEDALTQLKKQKYDLLICDLHLPGMSGPEFLTICKQENLLPKNVMIISGDVKHPALNPEMAKDFICLEKPFFVETFPDLVKKVLSAP